MNIVKKLIETVFQNTTEGFILTDAQNIIQHANPAFCDIFDCDSERLLNLDARLVISDFDPVRFADMGKKVVGKKLDGSSILIFLNINEFDYEGEHYHVGFIRDLEEIEKEKELTENLTIKLQETLHEVERQKADLQESQLAERSARQEAEAAKLLTEAELEHEMQRNTELQKGEGQRSISLIAVIGVIIICITPGAFLFVKLIIEWNLISTGEIEIWSDNKESWNVFENFGIYVIGALSGILYAFFGMKNFSGSEGRSAVKMNK